MKRDDEDKPLTLEVDGVKYFLNLISTVVYSLVIFWLVCFIWDYLTTKLILESEKEPYPKLEYKEALPHGNRIPNNPVKRGHSIKTKEKEVIIDLTSEEILEQLNLEYEDVRDYYGDELN